MYRIFSSVDSIFVIWVYLMWFLGNKKIEIFPYVTHYFNTKAEAQSRNTESYEFSKLGFKLWWKHTSLEQKKLERIKLKWNSGGFLSNWFLWYLLSLGQKGFKNFLYKCAPKIVVNIPKRVLVISLMILTHFNTTLTSSLFHFNNFIVNYLLHTSFDKDN